MSDPYAPAIAAAKAEFAGFTGSMQGTGVDASRAWGQVELAEAELHTAASQAEDAINAALDDPYITDDVRALRVRQIRDIYDSAERAAAAKMKENIAAVQTALDAAARSDFVLPTDASARMLTREDIRLRVAGARPGTSILSTLFELAKSDPTYAAELHAGFGEALLRQNGEPASTVRAFHDQLILATAPQTPKARAARAALTSLARVQAHAATTLPRAARARIEAPSAPRAARYQPDTIFPRR